MQPHTNLGIRFRTHFEAFGPSKKRKKRWARGEILRIEHSIRKQLPGFDKPEMWVDILATLYKKITMINRRYKHGKGK